VVLTRAMASLLFGIGVHDAATLSVAGLFQAVTALAASYIPARRPTRVDPLVALREEYGPQTWARPPIME
jgi:putative ABC transport system permease protein